MSVGDAPPLKSCFVVGPIGAPDSEIRTRSNQIYKFVIKPVTDAAGYAQPERSDMMAEPGNITDQIVSRLVHADLVVADLTGANPNVFYELAVRHALRKPFLQLTAGNETLPFDVAGVRTVRFSHRDLDSVEAAKGELTAQLQAVESVKEVRTPLSFALSVGDLQASSDPDEQREGTMLALLQEILAEVRPVEAVRGRASRRARGSVREDDEWKSDQVARAFTIVSNRIETMKPPLNSVSVGGISTPPQGPWIVSLRDPGLLPPDLDRAAEMISSALRHAFFDLDFRVQFML